MSVLDQVVEDIYEWGQLLGEGPTAKAAPPAVPQPTSVAAAYQCCRSLYMEA